MHSGAGTRRRSHFLDPQHVSILPENTRISGRARRQSVKRSAPDNDADQDTLTDPAPKRRRLSLIEALSAITDNADAEEFRPDHDSEEFRLAFEGQPYHDEADQIRLNEPFLALTSLCLRRTMRGCQMMLAGSTTNDHLKTLEISDSVVAVDALFEWLRGSHSLTELVIDVELSEQSVQSMLPFLMNSPN